MPEGLEQPAWVRGAFSRADCERALSAARAHFRRPQREREREREREISQKSASKERACATRFLSARPKCANKRALQESIGDSRGALLEGRTKASAGGWTTMRHSARATRVAVPSTGGLPFGSDSYLRVRFKHTSESDDRDFQRVSVDASTAGSPEDPPS